MTQNYMEYGTSCAQGNLGGGRTLSPCFAFRCRLLYGTVQYQATCTVCTAQYSTPRYKVMYSSLHYSTVQSLESDWRIECYCK